jgi:hypothetical protein
MSTVAPSRPLDLERIQRLALGAGGAGVILCALGAVLNLDAFFRSYLVAYCFGLSLGLGSLAILMLQHLTGGAWGLVLRRLLEAGSRTLPLLALLFVPLIFGLRSLYPWADPDKVASDHILRHKEAYLNVPFFLVRVVIYFTVWNLLAWLLNRMSRDEDQAANADLANRMSGLSAPGLGVWVLTMTFASIDWAMSLEPHWYSTMYGALFAFGQVLTAFSFVVALVVVLADRPPLQGFLTRNHFRDLGSLLLSFVMIWAYLAFSQFLLIYSANLSEETPWYLVRTMDGWQVFAVALILAHFVLPFLLLLSSDVKRHAPTLAAVAGFLVLMRYVEMYWVIKPAFRDSEVGFMSLLLDVGTILALGGLWLAYFLRQLRQLPLLPLHDARLMEVNNHHA